MAAPLRARDNALIDAIESIASKPYRGRVWRVVREGKDVLTPSAAGGRWDDGTFDVLYTSEAADGAAAEMYFHLSRGQPVIPSKVGYHLFEIRVQIERALRLEDLPTISQLGVDTTRYGALSYNDRHREYPRTQEVGETAHFIGFDALIAPNARWQAMNVMLFDDRLAPDAIEVVKDHGPIDWSAWQQKPFGFSWMPSTQAAYTSPRTRLKLCNQFNEYSATKQILPLRPFSTNGHGTSYRPALVHRAAGVFNLIISK